MVIANGELSRFEDGRSRLVELEEGGKKLMICDDEVDPLAMLAEDFHQCQFKVEEELADTG